MASPISHRRVDDSQFNAWSGIGNSWSYGSYGNGKTSGYYGKSSAGDAVALFRFKLPSSIPASATITSIKFFVSGCPVVQAGGVTIARLSTAGATTHADTPSGWKSKTDYLASATFTNGTKGTDVWNTYNFTGLSSRGLKAGDIIRVCLFSNQSSSAVDYKYTEWSPYLSIYYETASPVTPSSVTRTTKYSGFYSSAQTFYAESSGDPGYYFVTTSSPTSSSAIWFKRSQSTSNTYSCTFTVDRDTSTTAPLDKTYYLTIIPNYSSQSYTGAISNYKSFKAPRFAFKLYNNSSSLTEINSINYPYLPDFGTISGGYVHQGYSSSETSTACDQQPGYSWSATYDGKTRYAVYKRAASTIRVTLNANGGSISSTSASKTTPESWIYGKGTISGGGSPSYSNSSLEPTQSGYTFSGWSKSSSGSVAYSSAKAALDAGYTGTLYAVWDRDSITLTFYRNGGSGGSSYFTKEAYVGSVFTFPDKSSSWYKTGYTFKGWGDDNHPDSVWWAVEEPRTWQQNDPTRFYAIWEPDKVTLTYQPDDDTSTPQAAQSTSYEAGTSVTLADGSGWTSRIWGSSETITLTYVPQGGSVSNTSVRANAQYDWVIGGWSLSKGGSKSYNLGASIKLSSDMTLYPYWRDSDELKLSASFTLLTPTRSGYKFLGWDTNSNGTGTRYQAGAKLQTKVDMTLYAIWEPEGAIYINNGSTWKSYSVWIYYNSAWRQAIPYVYTNGQWKMTII